MAAPLKVFTLKGFAKRSACDLLGLQVRHVELIVISTSKKRAVEMLRETWVQFLVLDVVPDSDGLKTQLAQRHQTSQREGVYAYKQHAAPGDVLIQLLPEGQSALVDWLHQRSVSTP